MPNALDEQRAQLAQIREDSGEAAQTEPVERLDETEEDIEEDTPDEETTTPDEEEEEESTEEQKDETTTVEPEAKTRKESPFRQFNERRNELYQKETSLNELLGLIGAESVDDAKTKIASLRTSEPLSDEFIEAAKEMGIEDPEQLKRLSTLVGNDVRSQIDSELNPLREAAKSVAEINEERENARLYQESMESLTKEWDALLPDIESNYKPTPTQAKKAFDLMTELSHTEEYFDKDIDYIMFKEQEKFEDILGAPKRKGMLRSRGIAEPVRQEPKGALPKIDPNDHNSILRARDAMNNIAEGTSDLQDTDTDYI